MLLGDGRGGFRPMPGSPFALPGCANPRRLSVGSVHGNNLHDFVITCTNSSTILLFSGLKNGGLQLSSLDVPAGASGGHAERGVVLADLLGRGRDDIILSNGSANTITLHILK
jgi:hypothetical protein